MSTLNERVCAEIFRFENPGEFLNGVLREIDSVEINGRPTLRYRIQELESRREFSLLGTVDLNKKIRQSDLGKQIEIRFVGMETLPSKRQIKRFAVFA